MLPTAEIVLEVMEPLDDWPKDTRRGGVIAGSRPPAERSFDGAPRLEPALKRCRPVVLSRTARRAETSFALPCASDCFGVAYLQQF
jgi:hypothetical protein